MNTWRGTKYLAAEAWDGTTYVAGEAWEGTKEGVSWAAPKVAAGGKWVAHEAWEGTKLVAGVTWDGTVFVTKEIFYAIKFLIDEIKGRRLIDSRH